MYHLAYTAWQLVIGSLGAAAPPLAMAPHLTCEDFHLMTASGVIGPKHRYTFSAHCSYEASECKRSVLSSKCTNTVSLHFDVVGAGEWVRATGIATEKLKFTGSAAGIRLATGTSCTQDPWLKNPPSPGSCGKVKIMASVQTPGPVPEILLKPEVFLLPRTVLLQEAEALSQKVASNNPPPPPPPPSPAPGPTPKPKSIPTARNTDQLVGHQIMVSSPTPMPNVPGPLPPPAVRLVTEGEQLVKDGSFQVSGGRVGAQLMGGFGSGWSGNAQLLWVSGAVGSVLNLKVKVPAGGQYALELHMTRAPDYGSISLKVAGSSVAKPFSGYYQKVVPSGAYLLGTFPLDAGNHWIALKLIGKATGSTGYLVGVDKIVLTRR
jgi:hypothetical protein